MVRVARRGVHVVLLAGGSGTRFWPFSRPTRPKQFLALAGPLPILVDTWNRVRRLAPPRRIWVVAPAALARGVRRLLPGLAPGRLIVEPSPRDTAPAIALACATIEAADPRALVAIFPTDHFIADPRAFVAAVRTGVAAAARDHLVCLGVTPDRPATGFGYVRCRGRAQSGRAADVERFVEKPSPARAMRYWRSGRYFWNAGMFIWRARRFLEELGRTEPRILTAVRGHLAGHRGAWARAPRRSVDHAVMERARGVQLVPLAAGWDDLGSWDAAARFGVRAARGGPRVLCLDSPGSVVFGETRIVALVDVPGVVVASTADGLLIVARHSAERVREVVRALDRRRRARG